MEMAHTNDQGLDVEKESLIALTMIPGVGPGRIRSLVAGLGSATAVLQASEKALISNGGIGQQTAAAIRAFDGYAAVSDQLMRAARADARMVTYWDDAYPDLLRMLFDPPVLLWVRGDVLSMAAPSIAIVGTRKPTAYGLRVASYFAKALANHGFTIVSGLAYGIDVAAHRAALEVGGHSVAILGSGVDRIYPARHREIARDLMMQGALVSEFPLHAKPDAVNFPRRNRIISGLTQGTLVAEAFESGGALITARLALEQNREVFAVPGSIFHENGKGCHRLIQEGQAKLVHTVDDVLEELGMHQPAANINSTPQPDASALNKIEKILYEILTDTPMQIDEICLKTDLDVSTALVYLLSLEFKGLIFQLAGKQFYKV